MIVLIHARQAKDICEHGNYRIGISIVTRYLLPRVRCLGRIEIALQVRTLVVLSLEAIQACLHVGARGYLL